MAEGDQFAEAGDEDRFFWSDQDITVTPEEDSPPPTDNQS